MMSCRNRFSITNSLTDKTCKVREWMSGVVFKLYHNAVSLLQLRMMGGWGLG